jgi:hypothetical protein
MKTRFAVAACLAGLTLCGAVPAAVPAAAPDPINPAPTPKDYAALARLPDLSGVWTPDITAQDAEEQANRPPWKPAIAKQVDHLYAEEKAGRPFPIIDHCFPTGMPSYMLITHNAFELLATPGRITLLGEGDGNRLRRIYTDGRGHPADPDPSFHGHSIGHWEGKTLIVDTVGLLPQAYLAVSESVGIPNDGDMHIVERIHTDGVDTLYDELEITASKILSKPWKTTRKYYRQRAQKYDIVEGVCQQGSFMEALDKNGNSTFEALKYHVGVPSRSETK